MKRVFTVSPKISSFSFGESALQSGVSATVTCSVSQGDLPLRFSWLHNNDKIGERDDITIFPFKRSSMLTIDSVSGSHAGNYTCVAENAAGVEYFTAPLIVNGWFSPQVPVTALAATVISFYKP